VFRHAILIARLSTGTEFTSNAMLAWSEETVALRISAIVGDFNHLSVDNSGD